MTQLVIALAETLQATLTEAVYFVTRKVSTLVEELDRAKKIKSTIKQLNQLTDKELADIGLSRGMIRSVAMDAYR